MKIKQPIFIVGAGRSGTTIMKDLISSHPGTATNENELNYLWKYRNENKNDDIDVSDLNEEIINIIDSKLFAIASGNRLVEKTVANVLRVNVLNYVYEDCKIVHIIRDGRAVVNSAVKRWVDSPKANYLVKKSRKVPKARLPIVAFNYLRKNWKFMLGLKKNRSTWGPVFEELGKMVDSEESLIKICAFQWDYCVNTALAQSEGKENVITLYYEDLVENPERELIKITDFLGMDNREAVLNEARKKVFSKSKEKYLTELSNDDIFFLDEYIGPTLQRLSYNI